ncbi:hypothetical protein OH77DRAFT_689914 [Trametes cingulata]|nr:hypothetical protein OH77DRAFT_689914 [Trametes cingulata]
MGGMAALCSGVCGIIGHHDVHIVSVDPVVVLGIQRSTDCACCQIHGVDMRVRRGVMVRVRSEGVPRLLVSGSVGLGGLSRFALREYHKSRGEHR